MSTTENSEQGQPLAVPLQRPVRPAFIREHGHPDVVRGDAVPVAPGQRVELVLWEEMEAEVRRAVAAERERCAKLCEQTDEDGEGPDCWGWHSKDYARAIRGSN